MQCVLTGHGFRSCAIAAVSLMVLTGCRQDSAQLNEPPRPFIFRSLDLNQQHPDGTRDWDLKSPEARYELSSRTVRARGPSGILYRDNKPAYAIRADLATVLNDGELVVLEGQVQLQQLDQRKMLMSGDRLVWTPSKSTMVIDQRPMALDAESRLKVDHLTFHQDRNTLAFRGPTVLERWRKQRLPDQPADSVISGADGNWNLQDGTLQTAGPLRSVERDGKVLTASRLVGNTRHGYVDLMAPVRFKLPDEQGHVEAGQTRWSFQKETLSSDVPFKASLKDGRASGIGFFVDQQASTVIIPKNCKVIQPGETLQAERCSWNWTTEVVIADGDVTLRRKSLNQITRAERLEGRVGKNGSLRFGSPGERVKSRIRLEPSADPEGQTPAQSSTGVNF